MTLADRRAVCPKCAMRGACEHRPDPAASEHATKIWKRKLAEQMLLDDQLLAEQFRLAEAAARVTPTGQSDTRVTRSTSPLTRKSDTSDTSDTPPGVTPTVTPRQTRWTAAELMAITFPPPRWAVPDVIAEGVNVLAGSPKVGKSWMGLALAVDVATGGNAFGSIPVDQGDALYLALEDTGRRLQNRLNKVLGDTPPPGRLTLWSECPRFPEGAAHIKKWLDEHPDARLIVIDVLTKMRGANNPNSSAYEADYAAVTHAKTIADEYRIAIVIVHHTRKAAAEDFTDAVSGTNGIAGAADAILVLKRTRGSADGALHITGRDIDETDKALKFDPTTGRWTLLAGPAIDHLVSATRATILAHLRDHPNQTPKKIAEATGLAGDTVRQTCKRMADEGQITTDGNGHYSSDTA